MQSNQFEKLAQDYEVVEKAIMYIENNIDTQPSLSKIAAAVDLSEFYFQKVFSRWVGISPKRFMQYLTKEHAKKLLSESRNVLDTAYASGLSGPGRLHDLFVICDAVTPGEYKAKGTGISITYGICGSPFGTILIASTPRGICNLNFVKNSVGDNDPSDVVKWLEQLWPNALLKRDDKTSADLAKRIFDFKPPADSAPLHLHIRGTNFQIKVWEALLKIPFGAAVTYQDIAALIGDPKASRAVGNAVGKNPVSFLIPCHRVIRKMGGFGFYGGGPARKKAIIGWESAKLSIG